MRYYGRVQHPEFTDLAVVVGPNVRWVEDDYVDLQRYAPEVLLGYRVLLLTPRDAYRARGRRIGKMVVLDGHTYDPVWRQALDEIAFYGPVGLRSRVEWYSVHRGRNPVVVSL